MPSQVYCFHYQIGSGNCYKVGLTKNPPEMRLKGLATGSPVRPTLYRTVETEDARRLEKYIHKLLDAKRANGEFFFVTQQALNDAVDKAEAFVKECQQVLPEAKKLRRRKPNDTMAEPSGEMPAIYRQLREAMSKKFLLDQRIEFLVSKVQVAIGENRGMKGVATWQWEDRPWFDQKRFQEEHKTLYEEYARDSGCRKFRLL